jgi:hypothetical protein
MIENQGSDSAMHMTRRPLVCGAKVQIAPQLPRDVLVDEHRRRDRVTDSDDGVSPCHPFTAAQVTDTERCVHLLAAQSGRGRIDLGRRRPDHLGVHLGPDGRVDQLPNRPGQRFVDRSQSFDVIRADVLPGEVQHA